jgi:hypothetical protein
MYRRPKFLEVLIEIREEMAREADYDTDLFTELVRASASAGPHTVNSASAAEESGEPAPKRKRRIPR